MSGEPAKKISSPRNPLAKTKPEPVAEAGEPQADNRWLLRLFVAGQSPKSLQAYSNLKNICEKYLAGNYRIELIDLFKEPHLAKDYQIVAVPTLVRQLPEPVKRVIGDLSNHERALVGMDLRVA